MINEILEPTICSERIGDFEQISKIPQDEPKEILEQFDTNSLVIASMGASPEVNKFIGKVWGIVSRKLEIFVMCKTELVLFMLY